jgi:hypothetical protein
MTGTTAEDSVVASHYVVHGGSVLMAILFVMACGTGVATIFAQSVGPTAIIHGHAIVTLDGACIRGRVRSFCNRGVRRFGSCQ